MILICLYQTFLLITKFNKFNQVMLLKIEAFFVLNSNVSKYNYAELAVFCNVNYAWLSKANFGI
jgi:hypothetical protein